MTSTTNETRSPIKPYEQGLRQPGESIMHDFHEKAVPDFALRFGFGAGLAVAAIALGLGAVVVAWLDLGPIVMALPFVAAAVFGVGMCLRGRRQFMAYRGWRKGVEGERAVARVLEGLRDAGWFVFHDVFPREGEPWNIDHVLVGPGGIVAVETKWRGKPAEDTQLVWDGRTMLRQFKSGKRLPDEYGSDGVEQARRNARSLAEVLRNETGRRWEVDAALVFPGWWVSDESTPASPAPAPGGGDGPRLLVRNPKNLAGELRKGPARLSREDVHLIKARLEGMGVR